MTRAIGAQGTARSAARRGFFSLLGVALFLLAGCDGFFVKPTPPPPKTAGNFLYVSNGSTTTLAGFSVSGSGTLSQVPNSPINHGFPISSLAMTPSNAYLYVGSSNGIFVYAVNQNGSLTIQNQGNPVAQDMIPTAMQVDATGGFLLAAGIGARSLAQSIGIYQINSSTGLLTVVNGSPLQLYLPSGSKGIPPSGILITPSNTNVYVSLRQLGVQVLTLGSGGQLSTGSSPTVLPPSSQSSNAADWGLASDPNSKFLFVAEVNTGLRVLSIGTGGSLKPVAGSPYTTDAGPTGVILDPTGAYVYVANKGGNDISGFTFDATSGKLTSISGSPFGSGGQYPIAMASDSSKKYLAVINSGSNGGSGANDLQLFSYSTSTPGALSAAGGASTETDPASPQAIAATFPAKVQ